MMDDKAPHTSPDDDPESADDAVIGRAFRASLLVGLVVVIAAAALLLSRRPAPAQEEVRAKELKAPAPLVQKAAAMPQLPLVDITTTAGITFRHSNGATGEKLLPETMGGGLALFDFNDDGRTDVLFVNSRPWTKTAPWPTMALYRNEGDLRFTDATAAAGLDRPLYGMGAAVGDIDGDGDQDLYLTAVGHNVLYRNDGGTFTDVTAAMGVAGSAEDWSTSAGFLDYDNDGDLDLFVCNYVRWSREIDQAIAFSLNGVDRAYGPPKNFIGSHSYLFRNDGDTFTDVSAPAGIQVINRFSNEPMGKALAVAFVDFDRDGWTDILVANDTVQNFLFQNQAGTFTEIGAAAGVAYDGMGNATGAMGIDAADYLNLGGLGVAIGNFANETTSFYVQQAGPFEFADLADVVGIGSPSRLHLSFGVFFFDVDLDGRLDLLQANGHLEEEINQIQPSQHYQQPAQLFWNAGSAAPSVFVEVPATATGDLTRPIVGRGAGYADFDHDGDLDLVLTQVGGTPLVLRNDQATGHHWLAVRLRGKGRNRDGLGAIVSLTVGAQRQQRQVTRTKSYLTQVEPMLTFGLGTATTVDGLEVRWPDGTTTKVEVEAVDRVVDVVPPA